MKKGIVKWFDSERGYGFISRCNEKDIFVHFSKIKTEGLRELEKGQWVEFEEIQSSKGLESANVRYLGIKDELISYDSSRNLEIIFKNHLIEMREKNIDILQLPFVGNVVRFTESGGSTFEIEIHSGIKSHKQKYYTSQKGWKGGFGTFSRKHSFEYDPMETDIVIELENEFSTVFSYPMRNILLTQLHWQKISKNRRDELNSKIGKKLKVELRMVKSNRNSMNAGFLELNGINDGIDNYIIMLCPCLNELGGFTLGKKPKEKENVNDWFL